MIAMNTTTLLVIVCVLASSAAAGAVSPWAPVMGPLLSVVASCVLAAGLSLVANPPVQR